MEKVNNKMQWEKWAELVLEVFPSIKEEDTKIEVLGIENILSKYLGYKRDEIKIVDVCCGWGRHCFELAKRDYQSVVGVDISSKFMKYGTEKLNTFEGCFKPQLIPKNLFEIDFKQEFDVALNLWTSFGLYEDNDKNLEMLKKINSFLKIEGIFILDVANRERMALKLSGLIDEREYIRGNKHWWEVKGNLVGLAEVGFNIETDIVRFKFSLFDKDKGLKGESIISLKLYNLSEMRNLLKQAGFTIKEVYGDFDLSSYTFLSPRLIIVSEKVKGE